MPYLYGKRIRLRAAEKEDIPNFLRWINDPEVTEDLVLIEPMSHYEEEIWFDSMMQRPVHEHLYLIEVKDHESGSDFIHIGNCSFLDIDWRNRSAEVGIMIGEKSYWNQGYGTEVMELLLEHGFDTLNLHRIGLRVFSKNKRAIRAYEKAGFIYEGMLRQGNYQHGLYYDVHLMSVLKDEWVAKKQDLLE
jgi:RimJ/RimL family protein N-acetyltransferase